MRPEKINFTFVSRLSLKESWVIFFILGLIMLNYPFLSIFDKPIMLFGFPLTFIYIFGGWGVSILVIYLFTISIRHEKHSDNGPNKR